MFFRSLMKFAAVALILALAAGTAVQAADKRAVVIQMSDNDPVKWNLALNNAKKIQQELGKDKVDVEIVAYGPGINMLKFDSEVANRVTDADKDGVAIRACGNTMKAMNLTEKDLNAGVKVVPAGVIEIMNKQQAGWAYIRP
jgi:intracellular sulfur oxidation DsrE/DsrF family protein